MPGCEPFSADGGPTGIVVLHGFTGNPASMRGIAERMANAGFSVEMPRLPGHGTTVEDMVPTRFSDWSDAAEEAYQLLAARTERIVVVGLSMGGTLTCWLAERHPEIAGIVLVNPLVEPVEGMTDALQELLDSGTETMESIGSDIADPTSEEASYDATPVAALISLFGGVEEVSGNLAAIACPVLLFTSTQDHVVPPSNSVHLMERVSGSIEQEILERSFHVATLDFDADLIEAQSVAFAERIGG